MKKIKEYIKRWFGWLRHYVSPVFVVLLVSAFVLWYIAKLGYTYTTDLNVKIKVSGSESERFEVPCVVEGKGTNLFGYVISAARRVNIPLGELVGEELPRDGADSLEGVRRMRIGETSLQNAISVRLSDIKIISVGDYPEIKIKVE
ncbi:MAG: hypothetical protein IJ348_04060 [Alistipes sp.]|nr:hypothetical protein [Alistipes sp.]